MSEEAYQLLVHVKHAVLAWCILFVPDADRKLVDALTLDASCQSRTAGLLDAAQAARDDLSPSRCRTVADVLGAEALPMELLVFLVRIRWVVGDGLFRHASLCYSNKVNGRVCFDEMGGLVGWTCDSIYITDVSRADTGPATLINHVYDLRSELTEKSTRYVTEVARQAASPQFRQTAPCDTLRPWARLPDQIAAALEHMQSSQPQKEGKDIPLQALLPQSLAAIQNAYVRGHSLHLIGPYDGCQTARLGASISRAKSQSIRWTRSSDDNAYFSTLEDPKTDIVWVAVLALTVHPAFCGTARDATGDHEHLYEEICTPQTGRLDCCRSWCEGFSFDEPVVGDRRASLYELVRLAGEIATQQSLAKGLEYTRARTDECFVRRQLADDCNIRHIFIGTYREALRECRRYSDSQSGAEYGPYVARVGSEAVSFTGKDEADKFVRTRNKEKAMKEYRKAYPQNRSEHSIPSDNQRGDRLCVA